MEPLNRWIKSHRVNRNQHEVAQVKELRFYGNKRHEANLCLQNDCQ